MSFRGIWHIAYKQAYHLDGMNRRLGSRDCTGAMCDPWPEKPLRIDAKVIARRGEKKQHGKRSPGRQDAGPQKTSLALLLLVAFE